MNRLTPLLLCTVLLCACGSGESGSSGGGFVPPPPYQPRFMDRWKGVDSNFQLLEYEFANPNEGASSGTFNSDDSIVTVRDSTNQILATLNIQGSFNERDFEFSTLENGTVVGQFTGRFVEDDRMLITPTTPSSPAFNVYLTDDNSFVPDIEDTWQNDQEQFVLEYNVPFTNSDVAAFFNGTFDSAIANNQVVDGYCISNQILLRVLDGQGGSNDLSGTIDENSISLSDGRVFTRI